MQGKRDFRYRHTPEGVYLAGENQLRLQKIKHVLRRLVMGHPKQQSWLPIPKPEKTVLCELPRA